MYEYISLFFYLLYISYIMDKLFTTKEAAIYLGVTSSRIRQLIIEKRIKSQKIGRDHIINESELIDFSKNGAKKRGRPKK